MTKKELTQVKDLLTKESISKFHQVLGNDFNKMETMCKDYGEFLDLIVGFLKYEFISTRAATAEEAKYYRLGLEELMTFVNECAEYEEEPEEEVTQPATNRPKIRY